MEFWYIDSGIDIVFVKGVEMNEQDKFNEDFYFDIIENLNDTLYQWVNKKIDFKVKQAKQEKAKEIFDDLENLWCEKNNGTFTIYGYNELKKKHLGK